jgi:hypothetical protein
MKPITYFSNILSIVVVLVLTGCMSGGTKMLWSTDEGAGKGQTRGQLQADARPALDIPPSLRGEVEVPDAGAIAVRKTVSERYKKTVAGKRVALDARLYDASAASVFSAVLDGMTALNLPVESVDSASGTITTDWVRTDANNPNVNTLMNAFGGGGPQAIRYRYVARVLRETLDDVTKTRLEIRTMAQTFSNGHWTNKKLTRKRAEELFSRVGELLAK